MLNIGDKITKLRNINNLTQIELARALHTSNSSISAYETGARIPSIDMVIEISRFFNVSSDYLLGLSDSTAIPLNMGADFCDGVTLSAILNMINSLLLEQKQAFLILLKSVTFYSEMSGIQLDKNRKQ